MKDILIPVFAVLAMVAVWVVVVLTTRVRKPKGFSERGFETADGVVVSPIGPRRKKEQRVSEKSNIEIIQGEAQSDFEEITEKAKNYHLPPMS